MATYPGSPRGPTVLVVDDDCDQRTLVGDLLTLAGFEVVVACDGLDALERLQAGLRPTVIVLDLSMPRMTGWAFLERLRGPEHSTVPVLVTSGETQPPPEGADACLGKPVDVAVFRSAVERLCASASAGAPHG